MSEAVPLIMAQNLPWSSQKVVTKCFLDNKMAFIEKICILLNGNYTYYHNILLLSRIYLLKRKGIGFN